MKATRKLIPALAMLVVSAVVLSSASYAWFTMSREVTANGMDVTVTAPNNLLISNASDGTYAASTTVNPTGKTVYPASSIDGITFYAHNDAATISGNGAISTGNTVAVPNDGEQTGREYYVDVDLYLKTEGTKAVNVGVKTLSLAKKTATPDPTENTGLNAVRVAVLNEGKTTSKGVFYNNLTDATNGTTALTAETAPTNYQTDGKAINAAEAFTAASGTVALGKFCATSAAIVAAEDNTNTAICECAANGEVTHIVLRIWIEGESENCVSDQAANLDFTTSIVFISADKTV